MLPKQFDQNELFVLGVLLVLIVALHLLPKNVSRLAGFTNGMFFAAVSNFADEILGVMYPINFYDTLDSTNYELFDIIMFIFGYTLYGYVFICLLKLSLSHLTTTFLKVLYLLAWSCASTVFEGISDLFGVFHYLKGWNLLHSFLAYCLVFPCFYWIARWILKMDDDV
ncbi:hypothetical protein [Heyndrickxia acidiproducens]|uniref:hypothetical protein n=1 Tax=Heyndrickxia acidiproducens TaxID=1121084 RepID=UPI00036DC5A0|nr:hypothetical protein [Heyndrickxia acidiproducens]